MNVRIGHILEACEGIQSDIDHLVASRDEARKLAEEWRDRHCGDCCDDRPVDEMLPWEVEK